MENNYLLLPPTDNMGVENKKQSWNIDYLTITIWGADVPHMFNYYFRNYFRSLIDQGHGGRFYKETFKTDLGVTIRDMPVNSNEFRATVEIPGQACQALGYQVLADWVQYLYRTYSKVKINRIDLAFNYCPFSVSDVLSCVLEDNLRSYFKRDKVKAYSCPREKDEIGGIGTSGITLGGRSSTRYLRVYDKHGYTRLECEYKAEKADQVGIDILLAGDHVQALKFAIGHLRDYIDFFADWWDQFILDFDRIYKTLPESIKELSIAQIKNWFENQISSAFYTITTLEGMDYLKELYRIGEGKYNKSKFVGMVEAYKTI